MLAVTGATGEIGGRVAKRLIVRDPQRTPQLPGAEIMQISSYGDAAAVGRALTGVDKFFMVSAMDLMGVTRRCALNKVPVPRYDRVHQHVAMAAAAAAVGVKHIIYLSFVSAEEDATFLLAREHFHTEEYIRSTGIPFTFLRQSLYMDNAAAHASDDGVLRGPAGEGRVTWTARDDIADVAVAVLTSSGHERCTYDVTGPEALTLTETAEILSAVTGRKVTYQALTPHEVRISRNASRLDRWEAERRALTGSGACDFEIEIWISHYLQMATGEASIVSDAVPRLTGHKAISLTEYLHKYPERYRHLLVP
jgi:NAD(P)H dehydrogenase (quinone)